MLNDNAVSLKEKELARTAWEVEQCMAYLFKNRLMILKFIADGRHAFNHGFYRAAKARKWITSLQMADGFWEACKHLLYSDRPDGKPWPNDQVKVWAFAELGSYERPSGTQYHYDEWHRMMQTFNQN